MRKFSMRCVLSFVLAFAASAQTFNYSIDTFAGRVRVPDGVAALDAQFTLITCVTSDSAGNIYICSHNNGGIFRMGPDQRITRVFGSEVSGYSAVGPRDAGDGGPALEAQGLPRDAVVDQNGAIYFTQAGSSRVRRIGVDGFVTTIAGDAEGGFAGDGGPAAEALLSSPWHLAIGPDGSIYLSDVGNARIRRIDPSGVIETVAGSGVAAAGAERLEDGISPLEATLVTPVGIDVDGEGNLYICDFGVGLVRRVSAEGTIETVAGSLEGGLDGDDLPAVNAFLPEPLDVLVDGDGLLIDTADRIRRVSADGMITTVLVEPREPLNPDPRSLGRGPGGELLFVNNPVVRRVNENGSATTIAGRPRFNPNERQLDEIALYFPNTVQLAPDETLVIVDSFNHVVRKANGDGTAETIIGDGSVGQTPEPANTPFVPLRRLRDIAYDSRGAAFVSEWFSDWVRVIHADGSTSVFAGVGEAGFSGDGGPANQTRLNLPRGLAVDAGDNVYIADTGNHRIRRVDALTGLIHTVAGTGAAGFSGDGGDANSAQFDSPRGLDFDAAGNLYIADTLNHRIRKISLGGMITTAAGNGEKGHSGDGGPAIMAALNEPHRVEADADGYLYIGDSYNHVIRMITPVGVIHTIAGSPLDPGDEGDGGPALAAKLNLPKGVAVRENGEVLFSDNDNHRIRVLKPRPALSEGSVVNAASFAAGVAPGSIASVFGANLAGAANGATETPLPTRLSYSRILITDSVGTEREAGQFFASKTQSNFYIDPATATGEATLRIVRDNGFEAETAFEIAPAAPGLFAPGVYLRVRADGTRETGLTLEPIELGDDGDQVFLTVYATGLRAAGSVSVTVGGLAVPLRFAGEQGEFLGLDQVDVGPLPPEFAGTGPAALALQADGVDSNSIELNFN